MSTAHDTYPLRADWELSELSCHVIYISLFIRAKHLIIILLASASTGFKQYHIFTSLGYGHFRGVIYFTNNVINLLHQRNTVLTVYINITTLSPSHFATSSPSSWSTKCQVQNQLPMISYYSHGYAACSSSVVDVNYV
jgi:hypothetical protein